jgi:hypothetical protein
MTEQRARVDARGPSARSRLALASGCAIREPEAPDETEGEMKRSAILVFGLAALAASAAHAAFLTSYAAWSKLTTSEKLAYVRGLNDASSVVDTGEAANPVQAAIVRGRMSCLSRDQVTDRMLVALIDTRYQHDPSSHDLPPMSLFASETFRICRRDIQSAIEAARPAPEPAAPAPATPAGPPTPQS